MYRATKLSHAAKYTGAQDVNQMYDYWGLQMVDQQ